MQYDVKQRRSFLKRTRVDLRLQDLHIGAAVNINARQLVVRGYGDEYTENELQQQMEKTLLVIQPTAISRAGQILDAVQRQGFTITRLRMLRGQQGGGSEHGKTGGGGRSLAIEMMKRSATNDLAAQFGNSEDVFVPTSQQSAKQTIDQIFNSGYSSNPRTAVFQDSTLAIIRPHAVSAGLTGQILTEIGKAGFSVTDMELFRLEKANAEEFLEVYKGVVPEYHSMLNHLTSGPMIALEITGKPDIVNAFREFCGPMDPELARVLRPQSLRALFGADKIQNAVHCTDLNEDGPLEVQYFFRILVS
ncbi:Nucleoside diphosphate kinase 7 [Thoreauomyces humboldtii]|nr:Nucleoside diphosphate kinase 7 [Thoreauomyces humboldtii]